MRRLASVDLDTGEVLEGLPVFIRRKANAGRFIMLFQAALEDLATRGLTGSALRVLMLIWSRLDFENAVPISIADTARLLGVSRQAAHKSFSELVSKEVLVRDGYYSNVPKFRLSPDIGWKGKVASLQRARRERLKLASDKAVKATTEAEADPTPRRRTK